MSLEQVMAAVSAAGSASPAAPVYTDRADLAEFHSRLSRLKRDYIGLGDEERLCGRWAMVKSCENGHYFLKTICCGREWCPACGQDGSEHHNRRMARLMPRVFAMESVYYMIFEIPVVLREVYKDIALLRKARGYVRELIKRELGCRGVSRWHYYGEPSLKEFAESELGNFTEYKPHLNVLMEHGFIGKKQLRRLRLLWSKRVFELAGRRYYKTAPVYGQYYRAPGKRYHLVKYVSRSTFKELNMSNESLARALYGFNNTSWFGTFTDADKERGQRLYDAWLATLKPSVRRSCVETKAHDDFNSNICPICGAPLRVEGLKEKTANYEAIREFGGGLYEVRPPPWSALYEGDEPDCNFWQGAEDAKVIS